MKKLKPFPSTIYVYEETEGNGRDKYYVLCDEPVDRVGDGPIALYRLEKIMNVRHTVEVSDEPN